MSTSNISRRKWEINSEQMLKTKKKHRTNEDDWIFKMNLRSCCLAFHEPWYNRTLGQLWNDKCISFTPIVYKLFYVHFSSHLCAHFFLFLCFIFPLFVSFFLSLFHFYALLKLLLTILVDLGLWNSLSLSLCFYLGLTSFDFCTCKVNVTYKGETSQERIEN